MIIDINNLTPGAVAVAMCRLLDELAAEHGPETLLTPALLESMDIGYDEASGLLSLATKLWERNKPHCRPATGVPTLTIVPTQKDPDEPTG